MRQGTSGDLSLEAKPLPPDQRLSAYSHEGRARAIHHKTGSGKRTGSTSGPSASLGEVCCSVHRSVQPESFERRSFRVAIEHWVDVLGYVAGHIQKAPLVLKGDQGTLAAVIHRDLERFG